MEVTIEMARKMRFVQEHLSPMLKRLDPSVNDALYTYDRATGDEYVTVCRNGCTQNINVSADSMGVLAVDVIRKAVLE